MVIWIGTNDLGINNFITDNQKPGLSLVDLAGCQLDSVKRMYSLGARNFIVNSLIPLHLTKLYSNSSDPLIYWPEEHDGPGWHIRMFNLVNSLNALVKAGVKDLNEEWVKAGRGGHVEYFNTYSFFEELYNHPDQYFNGTLPANATGWCHKCPNAFDWHFCGM